MQKIISFLAVAIVVLAIYIGFKLNLDSQGIPQKQTQKNENASQKIEVSNTETIIIE